MTYLLSRPAVAQFTQRVFMLPSEQFFPKHTLMLSTLRKALVPAELAQHMQRLAVLMSQHLQGKISSTCKVDLLSSSSLPTLDCRLPDAASGRGCTCGL